MNGSGADAPDPLALPPRARAAFAQGAFAWLGVRTPLGPHVTPLVFAEYGGRLWVTTSRRSVKARAWKRDGVVAGLVRTPGVAVSFTGEVVLHDALDPATWLGSLVDAPSVTLATAEFMRKNARFFAGYARDARRVPLSWTPPGRVFAEIRPISGAVLDPDRGTIVERWGSLRKRRSEPAVTFRATKATRPAFDGVPAAIADALGGGGGCALATGVSSAPVIAGRWLLDAGVLYVSVPRGAADLAGGLGRGDGVAIVVDHAPSWRASGMAGILVQGRERTVAAGAARSGARGIEERLARMGGQEDHLLSRVTPERLVWWQGWTSGTVVHR